MPFSEEVEDERCQTTYDPIENIWKSVRVTPKFRSDCSIGEAVVQALLKDPHQISQICHHNGKEYTNEDIAYLSVRIAQHFQVLKVRQTEKVSIAGGNTDYVASLLFGTMLCGLTICPIDPMLEKDEIKVFYGKTNPSFVFTVGSAYLKIKQCIDELGLNARIYTLNNHIHGVPEITEFLYETGMESKFRPEPLIHGENHIAALMRSSGTTGSSKIVCVTHVGLLNNYKPKFNKNTLKPVFLCDTTLFWISGLILWIRSCLQSITSIIDENGFKTSDIPDILEKYKVTIMYTTPHLLIDILNLPNIQQCDFSTLRNFHIGGCCLPYTLIKKAKKFMKKTSFHISYGSSEACGMVARAPCNPENHNGQLVPNFDMKIVDEQGRHLGVDEIGEICTRSIFPFPGYYKDPERTADVYRNGWIHSGDLGYINKDGNLFVLDRKKDAVQYNGQPIYPNEIERIIEEIPGVLEVCVCGFPSGERGPLLGAVVCKSNDANVSAEEIFQYVAQRVEDYKKLRGGIYFSNYIPKTSTGKNQRLRAAEMFADQRGVIISEVK